ncbi:MAG: HTH domain-containing protein [Planctomycetes bacterium]|nr:HTH domain-containing protein [Planctomycetota bacterium]
MNYTPKQLKIMQYISKTNQDKGYSPTLGEIAEMLNVSTPTVYEHICALEKKGALRRRRYEARSLEVLDERFLPTEHGEKASQIEISGRVLSGGWVYVTERPQKVSLPSLFGVGEAATLLEVVGDFMASEGLKDGDILVVERSSEAPEGSLVVVHSGDGRVVLKRNSADGAEGGSVAVDKKVHVSGVVTALVRRFR